MLGFANLISILGSFVSVWQGASSVGRRFLADVNSLLTELTSTRPFFIRCIKPNMEKVAKSFTTSLVLEQLRCSGLMGAVKLMQEAYPTRVPYGAIQEACERILGKDKLSAIKCHGRESRVGICRAFRGGGARVGARHRRHPLQAVEEGVASGQVLTLGLGGSRCGTEYK